MPSIHRILDANANRAREALRVMEEAARFLLGDARLTGKLKLLRHDLAAALQVLPAMELHRDAAGDVGAKAPTKSELDRGSPCDVAVAAGKRLSEALRAIEEYAKLLPPPQSQLAAAAKSLRFRGYVLEHELLRLMSAAGGRQWKLCLLLTDSLCTSHPWMHVLEEAIAAGLDSVQVREKDMDASTLLTRTRLIVQRCHASGVSVIVNDRPDVAMLAGADGVHLGQYDLACDEVRKLAGRQLIIGVSTSNLDEARRAIELGADYCGVGPMFPTQTKHKDHIAGPAYLTQFVQQFPHQPHLAIGGINAERAAELRAAGCQGIAVSSAICSASDPGQVTRELVKCMT